MNLTPESGTQVCAQTAASSPNERDWNAAAAAVLRKTRRLAVDQPDESAWAALTTHTLDGVTVPPLGTPDRAPDILPGTRQERSHHAGWDIRVPVSGNDPERAVQDIAMEVQGGATSLWVTVGGPGVSTADLGTVLSAVDLSTVPVVLDIDAAADDVQAATALVDAIAASTSTPAGGTNLGADPLGAAVRRGAVIDPAPLASTVTQLVEMASGAQTLALAVDATVAHEAGAAEVGELAYSLASGVTYLRAAAQAGHDPGEVAVLLEFRFAATADQFLTLAKVRAARALWRRILTLCGIRAAAPQRQHLVSSRPQMTRYDPWVNLLRGTVAAFAAGVGGADAITVLPFDATWGTPSPLGRRLARNTSALLIHESRTAQVADPAGGAYAVEMLTAELARRSWAEFQRIEAAGGLPAALADGSLLASFDRTREQRRQWVADRRLPITGVSEFPDITEQPLRREGVPPVGGGGWAADFESLRDNRSEEPVFLATLGPLAQHNARAQFTVNALAVAGIAIERGPVTTGIDDTVEAFRRSGRSVVAVAGSDAAYREHGAALIDGLRASGATWIILAGRPPVELRDRVDDSLALGDDLVALLRRTHDRLARERAHR